MPNAWNVSETGGGGKAKKNGPYSGSLIVSGGVENFL